jgi:NAD-dependent oxidoreductase involved in siderophore biosynthesis
MPSPDECRAKLRELADERERVNAASVANIEAMQLWTAYSRAVGLKASEVQALAKVSHDTVTRYTREGREALRAGPS